MSGEAVVRAIRGGTGINIRPDGLIETTGGGGPGGPLPAGTETGQLLAWDQATQLWSATTYAKLLLNAGNEAALVNDGAAVTGIRISTVAGDGGGGGAISLNSAGAVNITAVGNLNETANIMQLQTTVGLVLFVGVNNRFQADATGIGFFAAPPVAQPTVVGSRGGNAALASLLTALASEGLIVDGTVA